MALAAMGNTLTANVNIDNMGQGLSSEAITAGYVIRRTTANKVEIANSAAVATATVDGVALNTVHAAEQPVFYAKPGATLTISSPTLTPGVAYYLGGDADEGEIGLLSDVNTGGDYATIVGIALTATTLYLICKDTGQLA